MKPGQDALKELFEKILGTPRVVEKIVRFKPSDDGVVFRDSTLTGLHNGALRTAHLIERGVLSCGCVGSPEIQCSVLDENFQSTHLACSECVFTCASCNRGRCKSHGKESDGQWTCSPCLEKARPFLFFKNLFGAVVRALE